MALPELLNSMTSDKTGQRPPANFPATLPPESSTYEATCVLAAVNK